jgi:hypothetical protein
MKAKLVNEIRRDTGGTGLGAVGVGNAGVYKGYYSMERIDHNIKNKLLDAKKNFKDLREKKMVEKLCQTLNTNLENMLWFPNWWDLTDKSRIESTAFLDDLLKGKNYEVIKFDKKEEDDIRKEIEDDPEIEGGY